MKDSDRILYTLTAARGQDTFPAFGSKLLITEATAAFQIAFDDRQANTVRPGMSFDFGAQNFRRITITNLSATADLVFELFYGTAAVQFDYLRTRSTTIRARVDAVTTVGGIVLSGVATAADATNWLIPAGSRRKHAILTNLEAAGGNNVAIYKVKPDTTQVLFGSVFPQTARVIEGDDTLYFRAASGTIAVVQTEEAFYV